jgi:hypothetical protein
MRGQACLGQLIAFGAYALAGTYSKRSAAAATTRTRRRDADTLIIRRELEAATPLVRWLREHVGPPQRAR